MDDEARTAVYACCTSPLAVAAKRDPQAVAAEMLKKVWNFELAREANYRHISRKIS